MSENWVQLEDDQDIIDYEVDESIELFENVTFLIMSWLMTKMSLNT